MKKYITLYLIFIITLSLVACSEKSGPESAESYEAEADDVKILKIGEAGQAEGLEIMIDKVATPNSDIFLNGPKDGFTYIKVYFTFKNISDETLKTPKRQAIYIVYEEGLTGDECDMTSDQSSADVLPGKKDGIYEAYTELAPGESVGGWMVYLRPIDKPEVLMHYYSKFINVPADLIFKFDADQGGI